MWDMSQLSAVTAYWLQLTLQRTLLTHLNVIQIKILLNIVGSIGYSRYKLHKRSYIQ